MDVISLVSNVVELVLSVPDMIISPSTLNSTATDLKGKKKSFPSSEGQRLSMTPEYQNEYSQGTRMNLCNKIANLEPDKYELG